MGFGARPVIGVFCKNIQAMKLKFTLTTLALASLIQFAAAAADSANPYANETTVQRDARMEWWQNARFGMFIHWGVYAVPAGTYDGKRIPDIGEWIMCQGKIPMVEYQKFAKDFNPTNYNADTWVRLAKKAGMKYIVITAKHHDGFAMFKTQASPWNIVQASPYGQDVLKPLAAACRKYGIKLGFYYSQAQDWNNGGSESRGAWDPAQKHDMDDYIDKVAVPQVKELLSNYGEFPTVLWWDTPSDMNEERAAKFEALFKLKPGIISNNRLGGGFPGDTETPEQHIPATGFKDRNWETCMTINDTWGYKSYDRNFKSTETLLRNLIDIASKGGNYLLNVGPDSSGVIPAPEAERLREIGVWMKVNGEAIYGTTASPFERLPWGRCTKKISADGTETTLYLHVFNWPTNGRLAVPGLKNEIVKAYLLKPNWLGFHKQLMVASYASGVAISVPDTAPGEISSTVVLKIRGKPETEARSAVSLQKDDGSVQLLAGDANLYGGLQKESIADKENIGYWINPEDTASWTFTVDHPGTFRLTAEIAAEASGNFEVTVGGQKIRGAAPATKDYTKFAVLNLEGVVTLAAGKTTLTVQPMAEGWHPMNLRSLSILLVGK